MKKYLLLLSILMITVFTLTGCAKCISTEYENVSVNIVDIYHRGAYSTPMRVGKVTTMRYHPAIYRTYVEYDGVEYSISGSNTYNKYKTQIGQTTTGVLEIRTYNDDTIRYNIISLE